MSGPDDPFSFDAEFGDPDYVKAARDPNRPPETGPEWEPGGRNAPIEGDASPFGDQPDDTPEFGPTATPLCPNKSDISAHLYALFPPAFVQPYPDAWIEIAFASPAGGKPDTSRHFSAFELDKAVAFAESKNKAGFNIYVGAALRHGKTPAKAKGRASRENVLMASHSWADFDKAGDDARIDAILKENNLPPSMTVVTGRTPHFRAHLWFRLAGCATADRGGGRQHGAEDTARQRRRSGPRPPDAAGWHHQLSEARQGRTRLHHRAGDAAHPQGCASLHRRTADRSRTAGRSRSQRIGRRQTRPHRRRAHGTAGSQQD